MKNRKQVVTALMAFEGTESTTTDAKKRKYMKYRGPSLGVTNLSLDFPKVPGIATLIGIFIPVTPDTSLL